MTESVALPVQRRRGSLRPGLWLGLMAWVVITGALVPAVAEPVWTEAEQRWLDERPEIRVSFDPSWPPFSHRGPEGRVEGIDLEVIELLRKRTGLDLKIVPSASWAEAKRNLRLGMVDVLTGVADLPERRERLAFTRPYLSFPVAIIMRSEAPFFMEVHDLAGMRVAAPAGYAPVIRLEREHPAIEIHYVDTATEALRMVADGRADATVENLASATHLIRAHGLTNLKIAGLTGEEFALRLAVEPEAEPIRTILDKALASITEEEMNRILKNWIFMDDVDTANWLWLLRLMAVLVMVAVVAALVSAGWNLRLRRELRLRSIAESELRKAHDQLAALNLEKDFFLGMAAHDLKSPLGHVILATDLLLAQHRQGRMDEAAARTVSDIRASALRMRDMIEQLLDINQIESGGRVFDCRPIQPELEVRQAAERFSQAARKAGVEMRVEVEPGALPLIRIDPKALAQVLDNLVANALRFTRENGVIELTVARTDAAVEIRVANDGPVIPEDEREDIFRAYRQGRLTVRADRASVGLGLAIVKKLVEAVGGQITCEDWAGRGPVFRMVFPTADRPPPEAPGEEAMAAPR